jgi:hypothetical protein
MRQQQHPHTAHDGSSTAPFSYTHLTEVYMVLNMLVSVDISEELFLLIQANFMNKYNLVQTKSVEAGQEPLDTNRA